MDYKKLDFEWYVPEWEDNRKRWQAGEEPNPLMVELCTPSYGYMRQVASRTGQTPEQRTATDKAYFTKHCRGVKHLTLDGTAVETGRDLWRLGAEEDKLPADLFIELFLALDQKSRLREGLAEGLSGPSDSA